MSRLPQVSGREVVTALKRVGWDEVRQRGSHVIMTKAGCVASLSIPQHNPLKRGTLHDLLKRAELTVDELLDLL